MLMSDIGRGSQPHIGVVKCPLSTPIPVVALKCYSRQHRNVLAVTIRENILRLREQRGWSRPYLGSLLKPKTSGQQIEKLEKGERKLTVDWIEKIALALDVDPAALVAGESGEFTLTEQVAIEAARSLVRVGLPTAQPTQANIQVLALMLEALVEMFARHPATRTDLQALRPAIDTLARQFGKTSS
jgi:transcriptional regulator with XRE-family HTH domain